MALASVTRALSKAALTQELLTKLDQQQRLVLNGVPRLPKGLVASALAQAQDRPLLVVTSGLPVQRPVNRCWRSCSSRWTNPVNPL